MGKVGIYIRIEVTCVDIVTELSLGSLPKPTVSHLPRQHV